MRRIVLFGLIPSLVLALAVLAGRGQPAYAWSGPAPLNTNAAGDSGTDHQVKAATDGAGSWLAVWRSNDSLSDTIGTDWDILTTRSTDNGTSWSTPAPLNTNAATDSAWAQDPQVATAGADHWLAVWSSDDDLAGTIDTDDDILVAHSTDNGTTWAAPAALSPNAATDSGADYKPQLATDGAGNWLAVWESSDSLGDTIGTDWDILVARSTNNGATWSTPAALNTNAATDSGIDVRPRVTTDGADNCVAVWQSDDDLDGTIGTDTDILVSRSTDNGATWTAPAALNTNAATDSGSDWDPDVGTDGGGNWLAVWMSISTDGDILVARSTDNGATWTAPSPLNTNAATDSGSDWLPQVATDSGANWVAVWSSQDDLSATIGTDEDILVARSTDNGATWTDPAALNTNAATDSGSDWEPQVATDGAGKWLAAWHSEDDLAGTIGTDKDVLYAHEYIPPYPPVGGIAELPDVSDSAGRSYMALAGLAAAALLAITAGGWYARRRLS